MPTAAGIHAFADLFLPVFIHRFLPDRKSLQSLLDSRFFSRVRRLSLEILNEAKNLNGCLHVRRFFTALRFVQNDQELYNFTKY
jgi:hypothetical protein